MCTHICIYGYESTRWQKMDFILGLCLKSLKAIGLGYRKQAPSKLALILFKRQKGQKPNSATMMGLRRIQIQMESVPFFPPEKTEISWALCAATGGTPSEMHLGSLKISFLPSFSHHSYDFAPRLSEAHRKYPLREWGS